MTALTLLPSFSSNQDLNNKGTSLPPWNASSRSAIASLVSNTSNWWSDSHSDVFYSTQNVGNNFDVEFQYGQNIQIWASAKFIKYSYAISNEIINPDNSITFDLTMKFLGVVSNKTSYANAGVSVVNKVYLGTQTIMTRSGNTIDNYQVSINNDTPIVFKGITLAPRASFTSAQLKWGSDYPNKEYPNAVINIGMLIFNPLYAWYIPMMTRKNSAWLPLNGNAGKILRRVNHYIAYAYNASGSDRFTTLYPNLNLLQGTNAQAPINSSWKDIGGAQFSLATDEKAFIASLTPSSSGQVGLWQEGVTANIGATYTISALIKNMSSYAFQDFRLSLVTRGNSTVAYSKSFMIPNDNQYHYITFSYQVTATDVKTIGAQFYVNNAPSNVQTLFRTKYPKLELGSTATLWMPSASEVQPSDYPSYYGSYYGQGIPSQNASDYAWSPMISPIPQNEMGWSDFSVETQGTENQANKGHNRRRTAGQFLQLPKLN